jgi:NAD(P)-dependent dehydrogenase (short-subunit alcohol dehydrogenase family)
MSNTSRIVLITGANKGIGLAAARLLGAAGSRILIGARSAERGEQAAAGLRKDGIDATFVRVDLGSPEAIHAAAQRIEAEFGRLDVLVNNAGIVEKGDGTPGVADLEAVRRTFDTNVLGTLAVTQAMLPLLRKSKAARIVNVSSGLGSLALNGDPEWEFAKVKYFGYNASKAAVNMLTVQLAAELADEGIKVNAADPGFTATDLNQHRGHQTVEEGAAIVVRLALLDSDGPSGAFGSSDGENPW